MDYSKGDWPKTNYKGCLSKTELISIIAQLDNERRERNLSVKSNKDVKIKNSEDKAYAG